MEYNPAILKRLQTLELSILDDFIRVCNENNLTWWAFGGTAIGALRHQGFIPWDDDIDVCLMRPDYDRLNEIFKKELSDKYIVVNADEFDSYPLPTTRITLRDSFFVEDAMKNVKGCPLGIFLDVYAFDHVAPDPAAAKKQAWKTWYYGKLMILSSMPFPLVPFSGIKAKLAHVVTFMIWIFLRLFRRTPGKLFQKMKKVVSIYNDQPVKTYAYFNDTDPFKDLYEDSDLFPLRPLPFEGRTLFFPHETEKTLEVLYGDFMQLPPVEKRKNHFPYRLKFPGDEQILSGEDTGS